MDDSRAGPATPDAQTSAGDRARTAGHAVQHQAGEVAGSARQHAGEVMGEARNQASRLVHEAKRNARGRAAEQTSKAAEMMQGWAQQLTSMARHSDDPGNQMATLARQGGQRLDEMARRLQDGGVDGALRDVTRFARQRPGMFLALSFGAGLVAGRLLKNADLHEIGDAVKADGEAPPQQHRGQYAGTEQYPEPSSAVLTGGVPAEESAGVGAGITGTSVSSSPTPRPGPGTTGPAGRQAAQQDPRRST